MGSFLIEQGAHVSKMCTTGLMNKRKQSVMSCTKEAMSVGAALVHIRQYVDSLLKSLRTHLEIDPSTVYHAQDYVTTM